MTLALVGFASLLYAAMTLYFVHANRRRKEGKEDDRIEGMANEEIVELGDESPRYVYTI